MTVAVLEAELPEEELLAIELLEEPEDADMLSVYTAVALGTVVGDNDALSVLDTAEFVDDIIELILLLLMLSPLVKNSV